MLDLRIFQSPRVKLIRQTEISECGLACLAMISTFHGQEVDLLGLRRRFSHSLQGIGMRGMLDIAGRLDLLPRAVKLPLEQLKSLALPAILHWDLNHYVVIERVVGDQILIHDPALGTSWQKCGEVSHHFTGVAIEIRPATWFSVGKLKGKVTFSDLWSKSLGFLSAAFQIIFLSIFLEVFLLTSPYLTQIAIDTILPSSDLDLLVVISVAFAVFTLMSSAALALRGFVTGSVGAQLGYGISVNIGQRLFRLPLGWFEKRRVGDVISRFLSVIPVQKTLTEGALVGIVDGCLAAITLILMLFYSPKLALISVCSFVIYVTLRAFILPRMRKAQEEALIARAKEQSLLIESIQGISSIRLASKEVYRHALWQTELAGAVNADIRMSRLQTWQSSVNFAVFGLENIAVISVGIAQIIYDQRLSVGMLMAFVAYKGHFITKANSLLDQLLSIKLMSLHLERLSDLTQSEEDIVFTETHREIYGQEFDIEFRGVSYAYSETEAPILKNVSFHLSQGEHVALCGSSGSGKSTLVKLLLGALKPTEGEILINGMPLERFGYRNLHSICASVTQDDKLFAGSIRDNIALFERDASSAYVVAAAMAASVHDEIISLPMQYDTLVGDMGAALSSGQRQRVLIARALYRKPKILIMDEGTANIDSSNEDNIFAKLTLSDATKLIVSHKPETVVRADRRIYLTAGAISAHPPELNNEIEDDFAEIS